MPEGRLERTRKAYASKSMRDIYNACSKGVGQPEVAIINGGVLNQMLDVTAYDPNVAYYVTKAGIEQIKQ